MGGRAGGQASKQADRQRGRAASRAGRQVGRRTGRQEGRQGSLDSAWTKGPANSICVAITPSLFMMQHSMPLVVTCCHPTCLFSLEMNTTIRSDESARA